MSAPPLAPVVGAIGPTVFAVLTWGSIALVGLAFGYVVWALLQARRKSPAGEAEG